MTVTKEQVLDVICSMLDGDYDDGLDVFIDARPDPAYRGEAILVLTGGSADGAVARFVVKVEESV